MILKIYTQHLKVHIIYVLLGSVGINIHISCMDFCNNCKESKYLMEMDPLQSDTGRYTTCCLFDMEGCMLQATRKAVTFLINFGQGKSLLSVQKNVNIHYTIIAVQSLL